MTHKQKKARKNHIHYEMNNTKDLNLSHVGLNITGEFFYFSSADLSQWPWRKSAHLREKYDINNNREINKMAWGLGRGVFCVGGGCEGAG